MIDTLAELETKVALVLDPRTLLGQTENEIDHERGQLQAKCHPDRHPNEEKRARKLFEEIANLAIEAKQPRAEVKSRENVYTIIRLLAVGDAADVYLASGHKIKPDPDGKPCRTQLYALKVARHPTSTPILDNDRQAVAHLLTKAAELTYGKYFPILKESWTVTDGFQKRITAYVFERAEEATVTVGPRLWTLEKVLATHKGRLEGKHIAWIMNRLLTAIGFAHLHGIIHGAVLPQHILVDPWDHGLVLIGWGHSVRSGQAIQTVPQANKSWYPPDVIHKLAAKPGVDMYLAAKTMIFAAGGDPISGRMPSDLPTPVQNFYRGCILNVPERRPRDAWELVTEHQEMLLHVYGKPKFANLEMP